MLNTFVLETFFVSLAIMVFLRFTARHLVLSEYRTTLFISSRRLSERVTGNAHTGGWYKLEC